MVTKYRRLAALAAALSAGAAVSQASAVTVGKYITFDAPGAVYTYPAAINANGDIAGSSSTKPLHSNAPVYGFLRTAGGAITTFNIPGTEPGSVYVTSINSEDTIVGEYETSPDAGVAGAFIRSADGSVQTFDLNSSIDVWLAINDSGEVAGQFASNGTIQCFTRQPSGKITTFGAGGSHNCQMAGINNAGTTIGTISGYEGSDARGFMRLEDGTISEISVPNAYCTFGIAINDRGWVAGLYCTPSATACSASGRGFLSKTPGHFTTFKLRGIAQAVATFSLNNNGYIVGYDTHRKDFSRGFLRAPDGRIATVDAPGAGTGEQEGTFPCGINDSRWITGSYVDAKDLAHGFLVRASR